MEELSNHGNGNYAYIDTIAEARKVLVEEIGATLFTVAKDVKIQVEFNPEMVDSYRLIGYENRMLNAEDFTDDTKDAGEMGSGHTVTALYEIVPAGSSKGSGIDLKYQTKTSAGSDEWLTVKLRYKDPDGNESREILKTVANNELSGQYSQNIILASCAAEFGLCLRDSKYKGNSSYNNVLTRISDIQNDEKGYVKEFGELVKKVKK